MKCSHIVECLREKGIEPTAFASSKYSDSYSESIALIYNENNYYNTNYENKPQWWAVDFKQRVSITSYFIRALKSTDWISQWTLSASLDNVTWHVIDAPDQGYPDDRTFYLSVNKNTRYLRFNGSSPLDTTRVDKKSFAFYYVKFFGSLEPNIFAKLSEKGKVEYLISIIFLSISFLLSFFSISLI